MQRTEPEQKRRHCSSGAAMLLGQEGKSEQKNMEIFVEYYGGVTNHLSML